MAWLLMFSAVVFTLGQAPKSNWAAFEKTMIHYYDLGSQKSKNALLFIHGWAGKPQSGGVIMQVSFTVRVTTHRWCSLIIFDDFLWRCHRLYYHRTFGASWETLCK